VMHINPKTILMDALALLLFTFGRSLREACQIGKCPRWSGYCPSVNLPYLADRWPQKSHLLCQTGRSDRIIIQNYWIDISPLPIHGSGHCVACRLDVSIRVAVRLGLYVSFFLVLRSSIRHDPRPPPDSLFAGRPPVVCDGYSDRRCQWRSYSDRQGSCFAVSRESIQS
jgi:hypothetical protein